MPGTPTKPFGEHVIADSLKLERRADRSAKSYRVTVNNYLAHGGDGFTALKDGTAAQIGDYDVDALFDYFKANSPIAPAPRRPHRADELITGRRRSALSVRPTTA